MSRNLAGVALDPVVNEAATVRRLCLDYTRQGSFRLPHHVLLALLDLVGRKHLIRGNSGLHSRLCFGTDGESAAGWRERSRLILVFIPWIRTQSASEAPIQSLPQRSWRRNLRENCARASSTPNH
jgi:hypothetical protein